MDREYNNKNREGNDRRERRGSEGANRGAGRYNESRERNFNRDDRNAAPSRERREYRGSEERDGNRYDNRGAGGQERGYQARSGNGEKKVIRRSDDRRSDDRRGNEGANRGAGRFNDNRERNFNRDDRNTEPSRERREYRGNGDREGNRFDNRGAGGQERGYQTRGGNEERRVIRKSDDRRGNEGENRGAGRYGESRERNFNREDRGGEFRERRSNNSFRERSFQQSEKPRNYNREENTERDDAISKEEREELRLKHYSKKKILAHRLKNEGANAELRLNRYISMAGICSRRDADELIKTGRVKVNDVVVDSVGVKVQKKDKVEVDGSVILPERKVYLVLNKPKDFVTTVEDPLERKTVMSLIESACKERVYPIGRLDRQTTGVLLFTNDGDLAKKLTHPKYDTKKIYHVFLDKVVTEQDMKAISNGIELEDGFIKADEISYASDDKSEVGIEIHSGKNRIVRRIFEHFGYQIVKLDRVYFAGITKKNIPRGKWRFLTSEEVDVLKFY